MTAQSDKHFGGRSMKHAKTSETRFKLAAHAVKPLLATLAGLWALAPVVGHANDFCPDVYAAGTLGLNFNAGSMEVSKMNFGSQKYDGLVISSIFNSIKNPDPQANAVTGYFERDLVARITGIGYRAEAWWNPNQAEILSDLDVAAPIAPNAPGQTVWPNDAARVPDGILPFEAIVVPEGFHTTATPGRITLINLDDPNRETYIVDNSIQVPGEGPCVADDNPNFNPLVRPRFYHKVKWVDMNGNGLKDAVTLRSGFKVAGAFCLPPIGEVVWFENPGAAIDPATEWVEHVIAGIDFGTDPAGEDSRTSADISIDVADLEGDGVPEIIGGNFFTSGAFFTPTDKAIEIYGAPVGATSWAGVNPETNPARIAVISKNSDNGPTFGLRFVDLNRDGKLDILVTNHQTDNCFPRTQTPVPGRVYALEQPASGDLFNDPWVQHTLKDNIRPNPTYPAPNNDPAFPGRLAPGLAQEFWPTPWDESFSKPWILVGGDEASKVWVLKPASQDASNWDYDSSVIFDINDFYGANTTQSFSAPAPATGVSISTIAQPAWRYDRDWAWGAYAEIYVPVFEGREIHRITFRPLNASKKITCPADERLACPVLN